MRLILFLACLGIGFYCFSKEIPHPLKDWQNDSLIYLASGNENLLSHQPLHALEDFQRANSCLDRSDSSSIVIGFLISFGQVIAYDCLGFQEHCKQSIGSLFLAINQYDEEEDSDDEISTNQDLPSNKHEFSIQYLRKLASISPSQDVRELLFSLIDDMEEELFSASAFKYAKQPSFGIASWDFDYGQDNISIYQCKSFWKKAEKIVHKVVGWADEAVHLYKAYKELKKIYDDLINESSRKHYNQKFNDLGSSK